MAKKIFLMIGDGYNAHFGLHTSYADFIKYRYEQNKVVLDAIMETKQSHRYCRLYNAISSIQPNLSIWDYYYFLNLNNIDDLKQQETNFEEIHYDSFESGLWSEVARFILQGYSEKERKLKELYPNMFRINDCTSVKTCDEDLLNEARKINFFGYLLNEKYGMEIKKAECDEIVKGFDKFYQCLYKEQEIFEKAFGDFLEGVISQNTKELHEVDFVDKMRNFIDPKNEYELQIIDFNFNEIGQDVIEKYGQPIHVHGDTNRPLFSGVWHNNTSRDNIFDEKNRFSYMFDMLYRRRENGLTLYKDIFNKDDDNILAFYGLSFAPFDIGDLYIIHNYRSKNDPIYHFYSKYDEDYPYQLGKHLVELFGNFYSDYFDLDVMDKFYELIEKGSIVVKEV